MFLRHLDLTTALRPSLYDDETLLFVQDSVGLYEGKFKIPNYQDGHAYLTSHRVCYVDNHDPRQYSVAVDLKEIERSEFYAGFLKSSPKVTLFPKASKKATPSISSPVPRYASPNDARVAASPHVSRAGQQTPTVSIRDLDATWICPICSMPSPVPRNFDPAIANEYTPLPACGTCGVKPSLALMVKTAIAALSNRSGGINALGVNGIPPTSTSGQRVQPSTIPLGQCPRCTFQNDPSMNACEMCHASLITPGDRRLQVGSHINRTESPGPSLEGATILSDQTIETIKFSFRNGGSQTFSDRLKGTLVQRKWLLQRAPPVPKAAATPPPSSPFNPPESASSGQSTPQRIVGIAGLEQRGAALRQNNQAVIGTAFEDLEALMTSAKEVIAMAEGFAKQSNGSLEDDAEARRLLSDSASALGLVTTKDMLGPGSSAEQLYVTQLARDLAEYLTDDKRGVLRKEGGIMSLIDLWQVFNRSRNGIELISPLDFEKAAAMWDSLHLPIRLRRFKSGLLVVQEKNRTDDRTIASLLGWLREPHDKITPTGDLVHLPSYGRGATAQEAAEHFGWSIGVATEELEMAEECGSLCRDQCLDGLRFWENHFPNSSKS